MHTYLNLNCFRTQLIGHIPLPPIIIHCFGEFVITSHLGDEGIYYLLLVFSTFEVILVISIHDNSRKNCPSITCPTRQVPDTLPKFKSIKHKHLKFGTL